MSDNATSTKPYPSTDRSIAFWIYGVFFVASVCCSIFIFTQFIRKPALRNKIGNHIILAVLLCSFVQVMIELPLVLAFFRSNRVLIPSDAFCTVWCYIDYAFNAVILMLIAYGSIERYLLVFHHHLIGRYEIMLHYLPIVVCLVYPFLFYAVMIFFYPCVSHYQYDKITCQGPCYLFERIPGSIDLLTNLTVPLSICIVTNALILVRVLRQKHRM